MSPSTRKSIRFWGLLLAISLLSVVTLEAILLSLATSYFTGGYQSIASVDGLASVLYYVGSATILDIALVTGIWALLLPFFRRYGGGPLRCSSMALIVVILPVALAGLVKYRIHMILGRMVSTSLLSVGSTESSVSAAAMVTEFLPPMEALVLVVAGVAVAAIPFGARRFDSLQRRSRVPVPSARALISACAIATTLGLGILAYANQSNETLLWGLKNKASSRILISFVEWSTDWDRDGYGYFSRPADPAPLDGDVHPFAIDVAGNGIDENGIAGDRPIGFVPPELPPVSAAPPRSGPHVLLIFLESFRADLIDADLEGRPITPFLSRFAKEGASSDRMYVHSPWTLTSRDQLFRGSLEENPRAPTLVDDFLLRGYQVAHFSGQDDSFGDSAEDLGFHRANRFYDAREDVDKRTSRSVAKVSLQVSWKTVLGRVDDYLDEYSHDDPLFMYVNIVDTHFPYTHPEVDEIIGSRELKRSQIRSDHADQIQRAYANTAANVDLAIERLITRWRESFGDEPTAIIITGDHGESFYEAGTLGHGQTVGAIETRVPLLVKGIGGDWPEPIGISDLRGLILRNLGTAGANSRPRFHVESDRGVFQYLGKMNTPEQIAMRRADGVDVVDLRRGQSWRLGADDRRIDEPPASDALNSLVWTWEARQMRNESANAGS